MRDAQSCIRFGKSLDLITSLKISPQGPNKLYPGSQKSKTYNAAALLLALSASLAIICLNGCGTDYSLEDVENMTDQAALGKVVEEAKDEDVRVAAVNKLTDQDLLARIALENKSQNVREAAVKKVMDQAAPGNLAADDDNWRIRLILKITPAFDSLRAEDRARLLAGVLPAFRILSDPTVAAEIGDIVSIDVDQEMTYQAYSIGGISGDYPPEMSGERFTCSIEVTNYPGLISNTWYTTFPEKVTRASEFSSMPLGFKPAEINAADLIRGLFYQQSQSVLAKFAMKAEYWGVRQAAVENITDQELLRNIAQEDENKDVRKAAETRLEELRKGGQ